MSKVYGIFYYRTPGGEINVMLAAGGSSGGRAAGPRGPEILPTTRLGLHLPGGTIEIDGRQTRPDEEVGPYYIYKTLKRELTEEIGPTFSYVYGLLTSNEPIAEIFLDGSQLYFVFKEVRREVVLANYGVVHSDYSNPHDTPFACWVSYPIDDAIDICNQFPGTDWFARGLDLLRRLLAPAA